MIYHDDSTALSCPQVSGPMSSEIPVQMFAANVATNSANAFIIDLCVS